MEKTGIDLLEGLLQAPKTKVSVIVHTGPDGDAMGSGLAWTSVLKQHGLDVKLIVPNAYPQFLAWMPGVEEVLNAETQVEEARQWVEESEWVFCLDFNAIKRMAGIQEWILDKHKLGIIDHHQEPENFGVFRYIDDGASSTCELIHRLCQDLKLMEAIGQSEAECLYTGLVTDTGSFKFSSTQASTHRMAADLLNRGVQSNRIQNQLFDTNRMERLKLLGYVLSQKMQLKLEGKVVVMALSKDELEAHDYQKGDTEGLVNYGLSIEGVEVAVLMTEFEELVKISFRSKGKLPVNGFAREYFNGGGHINAAGGRFDGTLQEALDHLEQHCKNLLP